MTECKFCCAAYPVDDSEVPGTGRHVVRKSLLNALWVKVSHNVTVEYKL